MPRKELPSWQDLHTIVFDFDGVFTNNKVWVIKTELNQFDAIAQIA